MFFTTRLVPSVATLVKLVRVPARDRRLPAGDGASESFELGLGTGRAVVAEHNEAATGVEGVGG
jgi:hypothetical protein